MSVCLRLFFLLIALLPAMRGQAEAWTPESLPMVHLQDARRYVCNPDGVLSPAAVDSADAVLARLESEKGIESVAVVVKRLKGDDPYDFGMALARKYGIGDKRKNTGLIIIIAVEDRSYQILTGRGLEGSLPDAICRRVENRVMVPALKQGDWDAAIVGTVRAIRAHVDGDDTLLSDGDEDAGDDEAAMWIGGGIAMLVLVVFSFVVVAGSRRRCPRCGKYSLKVVEEKRYRIKHRAMVRRRWRCRKCGYEETDDRELPNSGGLHGGSSVPPIIFGSGAGRGFGGGFGGGSFGGGSFGGGGSGGRF